MKTTIHHPHTRTHLPAHEQAARRQRVAVTVPRAPKPARPTHHTPTGRKTVDTRFLNH